MRILKKPMKASGRRLKVRKHRKTETEKIDFSDIKETNADFWANAELRVPLNKQGVYLRIDPEVLNWFKDQGKGYQTKMNAVLRSYVERQTKRPA